MFCFLWEITFPYSHSPVHVVGWRLTSFMAPDMSMLFRLFRPGHSEKYILLTPLIHSEKDMWLISGRPVGDRSKSFAEITRTETLAIKRKAMLRGRGRESTQVILFDYLDPVVSESTPDFLVMWANKYPLWLRSVLTGSLLIITERVLSSMITKFTDSKRHEEIENLLDRLKIQKDLG